MTLAQMILDTDASFEPGVLDKDRVFVRMLVRDTQRFLMPVATPDDAKVRAARFVFTEDAPALIDSAIEAGHLSVNAIENMVRLPSDVTWIEWRQDDSRGDKVLYGVMVVYDRDAEVRKSTVATFFVYHRDLPCPVPLLAIALPEFPIVAAPIEVAWAAKADSSDDSVAMRSRRFVAAMLSLLFLITIPRACELRAITHPQKLQRSRLKRGKLPFIEYKQVVLNIGRGSPRYNKPGSTNNDATIRRRLHDVTGHWRTYYHDGAPLVTWVPPHWRGDPSLGVVLRDRRVQL